MAHTKSQGAAKRNVNVVGKRLGVKKFGGQFVKSGNIIIRQRGTKFHPGINTELGRDFTIFAVAEGFVSFRNMRGYKQGQKLVDVLAEPKASKAAEEVKAAAIVAEAKAAKFAKAEAMTTKEKKTTTKKAKAE